MIYLKPTSLFHSLKRIGRLLSVFTLFASLTQAASTEERVELVWQGKKLTVEERAQEWLNVLLFRRDKEGKFVATGKDEWVSSVLTNNTKVIIEENFLKARGRKGEKLVIDPRGNKPFCFGDHSTITALVPITSDPDFRILPGLDFGCMVAFAPHWLEPLKLNETEIGYLSVVQKEWGIPIERIAFQDEPEHAEAVIQKFRDLLQEITPNVPMPLKPKDVTDPADFLILSVNQLNLRWSHMGKERQPSYEFTNLNGIPLVGNGIKCTPNLWKGDYAGLLEDGTKIASFRGEGKDPQTGERCFFRYTAAQTHEPTEEALCRLAKTWSWERVREALKSQTKEYKEMRIPFLRTSTSIDFVKDFDIPNSRVTWRQMTEVQIDDEGVRAEGAEKMEAFRSLKRPTKELFINGPSLHIVTYDGTNDGKTKASDFLEINVEENPYNHLPLFSGKIVDPSKDPWFNKVFE